MTTMRLLLIFVLAGAITGCNRWGDTLAKRDKASANTSASMSTTASQAPTAPPAMPRPAEVVPITVTLPSEEPPKGPPSLSQLPGPSEPANPMPWTQANAAPSPGVPEPTAPAEMSADATALLAAADPHPERAAEQATQLVSGVKPELAVRPQPQGAPVLELRYPWNEFARPSLQVVWRKETEEPPAQPPFALDGPAMQLKWVHVIDRLNDPEYLDSTRSVKTLVEFVDSQDGRPLTLRAWVNPAGKELAYGLDRETGTTLVFYVLNAWREEDALRFSLDDLDLAKQFNQPGKIKVWFLSNEQPVWSETLQWPGKSAPGVVQQPKESPVNSSSSTTPLAPLEPEAPVNAAKNPPADVAPPLSLGPSPSGAKKPGTIPAGMPGTPATAANSASAANVAPTLPSNPPPVAPPAAAAQPVNPRDMSIKDLAVYIEKKYKTAMSPEVRKFWARGFQDYFHGKNPLDVRRNTFMSFLRDAYDSNPPKDLANLFQVLFFKLDADQKASETH